MANLIVSMLFLAAFVCQTTGKTLDYGQLDPRMKTFVDLAIIKANTIIDAKAGHLNFLASGENYKEVNSHVRIDVRLKNTNCKRSTAANEHGHRPGCKFKKYEVYCIVCSKDPNTSDPYIDCVRKKDAQPRYPTWNNICPPHSSPGRRLSGETNPLSSSLNPGGDAVVENGNTTGTSSNVTADQENVMKTNASDYEFNYDYEDAVVVDTGGDDTGDITYY